MIGKNDEKNILNQLCEFSNPNFKDVGRKILLIKQGYLCKREHQLDIESADFKLNMVQKGDKTESQGLKVYADKSFIFQVNKKTIFRMWRRQLFDSAENSQIGLKLEHLHKIFPEFKNKLDLYVQCCNSEGNVVKNTTFFTQYKAHPDNHYKAH